MTILSVILVLTATVVGATAPPPLDVYWIDVEGGAATLIVTPAGESVLVDAGNPGGRDASRIHQVATEQAGLSRIDHLVVTHLHKDHFGGVAELGEMMPIGALYENGVDSAPKQERSQPEVAAYQGAKVERRVRLKAGQLIDLKQAPGTAPVTLRVLATRQEVARGRAQRPNAEACRELSEKEPDKSDNANSVVLLLELGPFRFFDGGDLTWNVEPRLVCPDDRVGPVDVFQSSHHGLDSSNNPVLLRTLEPHVVVFNNGARKGDEAGAAASVRATRSLESIYQLHRNVREGALNTDAARIANAEEQCAGNYVRMSVDPSGETYALSVPATGHSEGYQTRRAAR